MSSRKTTRVHGRVIREAEEAKKPACIVKLQRVKGSIRISWALSPWLYPPSCFSLMHLVGGEALLQSVIQDPRLLRSPEASETPPPKWIPCIWLEDRERDQAWRIVREVSWVGPSHRKLNHMTPSCCRESWEM